MLLQFTAPRIITNHDNGLLQFMIGALLQITTTVITICDRYCNSRQLLLQFTTGITIHDVITIHDSTQVPSKITKICRNFPELSVCMRRNVIMQPSRKPGMACDVTLNIHG